MATPTFTVGVTGHRPNRLAIGKVRVARRIELVLAALRRGARGRRKIAVTALAEGADRIFARESNALGFQLHALLPFASADYETTFGNPSTTAHYRALLAAAAHREELPGSLADTKSAYEAVGRLTVERSQVLVAVWDGKPAGGRGGTPEIIEYALLQRRPVIWIDAARERRPAILFSASLVGRTSTPLTALARRARPASRAAISALAAGPRQGTPAHQ